MVDGEYQPIEIQEVDGRLVGVSDVLGLELHADAEWFRLLNPESGEYLPDTYEINRARKEAERGLASERRAREEAEKAEQSRRELERLLREHGIEPPSGADGGA